MTDTAEETERLVALMGRYGIAEFEFREETWSLRIVNGVVSEPDAADETADTGQIDMIRSPAVGRFRQFAVENLPRAMEAGEILGFVTSGSLRLPVSAPSGGMLLSPCHADDTAVGYGTALFQFRPAP